MLVTLVSLIVTVVFGRLFVKRFTLCYQTVVCLSVMFVHCGQMVGRIKMKLGIRVGLGPGRIVLDGDLAPPPQRAQPPIFGPYLLRPNGCMDHDVTWYGARCKYDLTVGQLLYRMCPLIFNQISRQPKI